MPNPVIPEARAAAEKILDEAYEANTNYDVSMFDEEKAAIIISEHMRERDAKAMRALESLTPGGSEFVNDVERCVSHVRDRQNGLMEQVRKRAARDQVREREWQSWRAQLLDAWRNDYRATMTALLEGGPERRNP